MLNFAAVALRGNGMSFNRNRDSLLSAAETERGTRAGNTASRHRSPEAGKAAADDQDCGRHSHSFRPVVRFGRFVKT